MIQRSNGRGRIKHRRACCHRHPPVIYYVPTATTGPLSGWSIPESGIQPVGSTHTCLTPVSQSISKAIPIHSRCLISIGIGCVCPCVLISINHTLRTLGYRHMHTQGTWLSPVRSGASVCLPRRFASRLIPHPDESLRISQQCLATRC